MLFYAGRSFMFSVGGRIFFVLRWQKFLRSPSVAEFSMFFYAGRSSHILRRWQNFQCSSTLAEVLMFSVGDRIFYVLLRWQKFLFSLTVAEISVSHSVQLGTQACPASYTVGTGESFSGGKATES